MDAQPIFLFEKDTFDEGNPEKMMTIAQDKGCEAYWFDYVPLGGGLVLPKQVQDKLESEERICSVFYGTLNMTRYVKGSQFIPGVWEDDHALSCSTYYSHWSRHMLNQRYGIYSIGEIGNKKDWLFFMFGDKTNNPQVLIRPNANTKSFHGGLVTFNKFEQWFETALFYDNDPSQLAVVATPSIIYQEFRVVIYDGKAIASSEYKNRTPSVDPVTPDVAAEKAEKLIKIHEWQPDRLFVLDIARTPEVDGLFAGWKIIECGSINCCGLYKCELEPIVDAMADLAVQDFKGYE